MDSEVLEESLIRVETAEVHMNALGSVPRKRNAQQKIQAFRNRC